MLSARQSYYSISAPSDLPMIVTVDTRIVNVSPLGSMRINFTNPVPVGCRIDWGDGTNQSVTTSGVVTKAYAVSGVYDIKISGQAGFQFTDSRRVLNVKQWGTLRITNAAAMFQSSGNFIISATDIPNFWGNVDASAMFTSSAFNQPIGHWNMANIVSTNQMFFGSTAFNQNIGNWNMSNATNIGGMFWASVFNNGVASGVGGNTNPIEWNLNKVTSMEFTFRTNSFNRPMNINVSNVANFTSMFAFNSTFNQPIQHWDTGNAVRMDQMFVNSTSFNQPVGNLNVAKVTTFQSMFAGAANFNNGLAANVAGNEMNRTSTGGWQTGNVVASGMNNMFNGAARFNQNLGNWCVTNITSLPTNFSTNTGYTQPRPSWGTCPILN